MIGSGVFCKYNKKQDQSCWRISQIQENENMKIKEVRSAIDIIRDASKADLIIVSLFLLPILLGIWSIFFMHYTEAIRHVY